jgi:hypothetical protein
MSSPQAAPAALPQTAAASRAATMDAASSLSNARAEASRRNGAQSRGPKTPEGKARSAQNALKHGLRAQKFVVVGDEKAAEFAALEAALSDELAPEGALQRLLAGRIARAAWRLERAERIEAELFVRHADRDRNLGLALIRDGHGSRAFDTLLRYRGSALAELWRALRLLKALQAEAGAAAEKRSNPKAAQILAKRRLCRRRTNRRRHARAPMPMSLPAKQSAAGWNLVNARGCRRAQSRIRQREARDRSNPKPAQTLTKLLGRRPRTKPRMTLRAGAVTLRLAGCWRTRSTARGPSGRRGRSGSGAPRLG